MKHTKTVRHGARRALSLLSICLLLFSVLCVGMIPAADAASGSTDAKVKNYEDQMAKLEAEQKSIAATLADLRKQSADVTTQKKKFDEYLDTTQRRIDATYLMLDELERDIAETDTELREKEAQYAKTYQQFLDMMVLSYEEGDASYLGLILGADSLGDFLSRIERVSSMLDYNHTVMETLQKTSAALKEQKENQEARRALQEQTLAELKAEKDDYQAKADEALAEMQKLTQNQKAWEAEYYKNKAEEDALDKKIQERLLEIQRENQAKMEAGDWLWPIDLSVQQYNSSGYGWRKLYGVWDFHRGWDIACWAGNDIHAAKSGTVVIAEYHYSYGNYVVIDHGDGVSTVYGHASKLCVSKGDKVKKGDVIAKVGTSGNSTGNHLHFEFRLNGQYTDPFNYIKKPPISVYASVYTKS